MPESSNKYRLEFVVKDGIAKGYTVILTQQNIDHHQQKYGNRRPELTDNNFFDKDVKATLENPDLVYPSISGDPDDPSKFSITKNIYVFYKEKPERSYTINSSNVKCYSKVVVRKKTLFRKLEIVTTYYSFKINEEKRCQPITKI